MKGCIRCHGPTDHEGNCERCDRERKALGPPDAEACSVALTWHPGPARGGEGTAGSRDGGPWWWDSELLLVVVETRGGPSVSMVRVHADGDELGFYDSETGDDLWGYSPEDISWWTKIKEALPQNATNLRLGEMEKALKEIARQNLSDEMDDHSSEHADWEGGYEAIVRIARTAICPQNDPVVAPPSQDSDPK